MNIYFSGLERKIGCELSDKSYMGGSYRVYVKEPKTKKRCWQIKQTK